MKKNSKIYVAGHNGMVGSAIVRKLQEKGYTKIISASHDELDLRNIGPTETFFRLNTPEYVFLAAAKVGGIMANDTYKAEFIYDNLMIECNVIHAAYKYHAKKLLFIGSSCIYPNISERRLKEEDLFSGYLEPTNEPYAIAKIAGIKLCETYRHQYGCNFISAIPPNLYGRWDDTYVVPSLIRRFHEAKLNGHNEVVVWGSGNSYREFMYSDDFADACIFLMLYYDGKLFVNAGTGEDVSIRELAFMIKEVVGLDANIVFDTTKPDGSYRKVMDISRLHAMGWKHKVTLAEGIELAYKIFKE